MGVQRSCWGTDPLFRGSYSYMTTRWVCWYLHCSGRHAWSTCIHRTRREHLTALAAPVVLGGVPVLCFAGEATHPTFFGTTHGALLSGKREALRVLARADSYYDEAGSAGTS